MPGAGVFAIPVLPALANQTQSWFARGRMLMPILIYGWWAGRSAQMRGRRLLFATSVAAALGLAMILLKDLV